MLYYRNMTFSSRSIYLLEPLFRVLRESRPYYNRFQRKGTLRSWRNFVGDDEGTEITIDKPADRPIKYAR